MDKAVFLLPCIRNGDTSYRPVLAVSMVTAANLRLLFG